MNRIRHCIVSGILILLCSILFTGCNSSKTQTAEDKKEEETMISVLMTCPKEINADEAESNYSFLKKKLELLTKGENYQLTKDNSLIHVSFPEKVISYATPDLLVSLLTEPLVWEVQVDDSHIMLFPYEILSLKAEEGSVELENPEKELDDGYYNKYLQFIFSDDFYSTLRIASPYNLSEIKLCERSTGLEITLNRGKDQNYYFCYSDMSYLYGIEDFFFSLFTEPTISTSYDAYYEEEIIWETDPEDFSNNQYTKEKMPEDSIYLQYSGSIKHPYDQVQETVSIIKSRLDSLSMPYAFGFSKSGNLAVLLKQNPLTKPEVSYLTTDTYAYIICGEHKISGLLSGYDYIGIDWMENEQCFGVNLSSNSEEKVDKWREEAKYPVYLAIGEPNNRIAVLSEETFSDFSMLKFVPEGLSATRLNYIKELILNPVISNGYAYNFYYAKTGDKINTEDLFAVNPIEAEEQARIKEQIAKLTSDAEIKIKDHSISVQVNDYAPPAEALELVKKLEESLTPEILCNYYLSIRPAHLDSGEKGRIELWDHYDYDDPDKLIRNVGFYFRNGTMEDYKQELLMMVEKDSYWDSFEIEK